MTNNTTTTFKSTELGTVTLTTYVDPHPGLKGTDKVAIECGMCRDGVYTGYSRIHWQNGKGDTTWCFWCNGTNRRYISVSTARRNAKRQAFQAEYAVQIEANRIARETAANVAIAAAKFEAAWDEAHAEQARRAAMVQGFLGEVGDKVATGPGIVQVAKYIEGSWNRSSSMFIVVKLDSGQVVKTFGSSTTLFGLERGYRVTLTGKVKAQETYQGQDQTVLSHTKAEVLDEDD